MKRIKHTESLLDKVRDLVDEGFGRVIIARKLGISGNKAWKLIRQVKGLDEPEIEENQEDDELSKLLNLEKREDNTVDDSNLDKLEKIDILIVGDAHAKPGVSNERFTKLGKLIVDYKPHAIVQIGDFFDFPSLSSFDVGKKTFEGRRYKLDLEAGWDAQERIENEINKYNKSVPKTKAYKPSKKITIGNHENRINKAVNSDPKLDGILSISNMKLEKYGWEVYSFLEPLLLRNITFQHYFTSGSMDRPISTENTGRTILRKLHSSAFAGHNHKLDLAWEANGRGDLMMAGSVGCYFEHLEEWQSVGAQKHFWRGVILLKGVSKTGKIDNIEMITLESINNKY